MEVAHKWRGTMGKVAGESEMKRRQRNERAWMTVCRGEVWQCMEELASRQRGAPVMAPVELQYDEWRVVASLELLTCRQEGENGQRRGMSALAT